VKRRANLPPSLGALVMRCLEKRPADRPQTASEVVHALDDITTPSGGVQPTAARSATEASAAPSIDARRRIPVVAVAIAGMAIIGVLVFTISQRGKPSAAAGTLKSLAVLPLVNVSGDTADQYFVDGMTDEVTTAIARVPGLRVASRSAASNIDTRKEIRTSEVARRLNVAALLEGRLRRQGTRLRLTMQLTNGADGLSLWSESFEAEAKDAFAVQDQVARSVASALRLALSGDAIVKRQPTSSPEAHDLVLRGRYQTEQYNGTSLRQAIALFERAIAIDSNYVDAWAGLGDAWTRLADDFVPANEAVPHARVAIAHALALDSTNNSALTAHGAILQWYDRRLGDAERVLNRALIVDSTNAAAATWYAYLLLADKRPDSAAALVERMRRIDPLGRLMLSVGTRIAIKAGRLDIARDACRRAVETDSIQFGGCKATLLEAEGKYEQTLAMCATGPGCRAVALGRLGRRDEALREARLAEEALGSKYYRPISMAQMWAQAGDPNKAMEWLEREERNGGSGLMDLLSNSYLAPLRTDARFQAMAKRVGAR
jgi:TolB-like protein